MIEIARLTPRSRKRRNNLARIAALALAVCLWATAWGFASAAVGEPVANATLATINGGQHPLLAAATVNVFVFVKPGQEHSEATLRQLAKLAPEFAQKPVHWVAIISDQVPVAEVARAAAGLGMPVLIDAGDALYGRLGVTLEPCTGITNADHRLVAYLPFTKVNYTAVVRARILHTLKEIDDAELARVSNPAAATNGGEISAAHRRLKLAEKLFQSKLYGQALTNVKSSLEKDPKVAAAHALLGQILVAQNQRDEALRAFAQALALDPAEPAALRGKAELESPGQKP